MSVKLGRPFVSAAGMAILLGVHSLCARRVLSLWLFGMDWSDFGWWCDSPEDSPSEMLIPPISAFRSATKDRLERWRSRAAGGAFPLIRARRLGARMLTVRGHHVLRPFCNTLVITIVRLLLSFFFLGVEGFSVIAIPFMCCVTIYPPFARELSTHGAALVLKIGVYVIPVVGSASFSREMSSISATHKLQVATEACTDLQVRVSRLMTLSVVLMAIFLQGVTLETRRRFFRAYHHRW